MNLRKAALSSSIALVLLGGVAGSSSLGARTPIATPPNAPSVTISPTISGTAQAGNTLKATTGTWSGSPKFSYVWQECTASCRIAQHGTGSTYALTSADVGSKIRVAVEGSNEIGGTTAYSANSSRIEAAAIPVEETKPPPVEEKTTPVETTPPPTEGKNCINVPSVCGLPDATNSGVVAGSTLTTSTGKNITTAGTTKNVKFTGEVTISASNVTLENVETNEGIRIGAGLTNVVVKNDTCNGKNIQNCVFAKSKALITDDYFTGCGECINGAVTLTNSYIDVSAVISGEHYEAIYYGGGEGTLNIEHNTLFSPNHDQGETAVIFTSSDFGNQTGVTIKNNLLAGGNYTIYGGTTGSGGKVTGPYVVTGNRFSRKYDSNGGFYGIAADFNEAKTTWSGNIWDETLAVAEQ